MSQQENATKAQVFSNRLIGARNRAALSQQELADRAEVSLRSIQNWERGAPDQPMPQGKHLRKICEVLKITPDYLFGEEMRYPSGQLPGHLITENPSKTERDCRNHLEQFLAKCESDEVRLGWTYVELQDHFPLDKWEREIILHERRKPASSADTSQAAAEAAAAADRLDAAESEGSGRSSGVGGRPVRKGSRVSPSSPQAKVPPPAHGGKGQT